MVTFNGNNLKLNAAEAYLVDVSSIYLGFSIDIENSLLSRPSLHDVSIFGPLYTWVLCIGKLIVHHLSVLHTVAS